MLMIDCFLVMNSKRYITDKDFTYEKEPPYKNVSWNVIWNRHVAVGGFTHVKRCLT